MSIVYLLLFVKSDYSYNVDNVELVDNRTRQNACLSYASSLSSRYIKT